MPPAADESLKLVHTTDYLDAVISGRIDARMQRRIGFPWSEELIERSRRSVGAQRLQRSETAQEEGIGINLAGVEHTMLIQIEVRAFVSLTMPPWLPELSKNRGYTMS